jgi:hypothetical protein
MQLKNKHTISKIKLAKKLLIFQKLLFLLLVLHEIKRFIYEHLLKYFHNLVSQQHINTTCLVTTITKMKKLKILERKHFKS